MARPIRDLTNKTFGSFTVLGIAPRPWKGTNAEWFVRCLCGHERRCVGNKLVKGDTVSCGCHRRKSDAGYTAIHYRIRRARGSATEYSCVDCTNPAEEWSYKDIEGYSDDPQDYSPRCVRCHRRYDASLRG